MSNCEICGEPMPPGETMFKYHGYSGPCPKAPKATTSPPSVKHTPGPWRAYQPSAIDYRAMHITNGESLIAMCCGGGPKRAVCGPEERANAALIAAAPDLLAVLRRLRKATAGYIGGVFSDADTAIAKAEDAAAESKLASNERPEGTPAQAVAEPDAPKEER